MSEPIGELVKKKQAIIIRNVTFGEIKKELEKMYGDGPASLMLFEAGKACGKRSAWRVATEYGVKGHGILVKIEEIKRQEGWGTVDFRGLDLATRSGKIILLDSFEALGHGESQKPVCSFLRGYLSGVLTFVSGAEVALDELDCIAKGDDTCRFILR